MVNKDFWLAILVMILVFGMTVIGCDNDSINGNEKKTVTYKGMDLAGNEYTLIITKNTARIARKGQSEGNQGEDNDEGSGKKGECFMMKIKPDGGNEVDANGTISDIIDGETLMLKTSDDSEFTVTIQDGEISSIVGEITLADGMIFIVCTFATIYLRATRYADSTHHTEFYESPYTSIKLSDIYSGTFDDLISVPYEEWCTVKISGNVDRELKYFKMDVQHVTHDGSRWTFLGGGIGRYAEKFGPGEFSSVELQFESEGVDISTLPDGEVILQFKNELYFIHHPSADWDRDSGERIPDDFPQGGIWATIRNLTIEPVDWY